MIMVTEQAALKAQAQFEQILDFVQPGRARRSADRHGGTGPDATPARPGLLPAAALRRPAGRRRRRAGGRRPPRAAPLRRLPERHDRRYVSIFGELTIPRVVYGTREGQKIERVPLDERLGLPEGDFSYVLEDWGQRLCLKESFAEAGQSLEMLLGLRLGTRTLEQMNRAVAGYAPSFQDAAGAAPAVRGRAAAGRHRRRQGGADATPGAGRPEAAPPPDQGGEGEQEADGLRRGGLQHRAVRAHGRRHHRRGAAGREGQGAAPAAAQARLGGDDPGGRGRAAGDGQGGAVLPA